MWLCNASMWLFQQNYVVDLTIQKNGQFVVILINFLTHVIFKPCYLMTSGLVVRASIVWNWYAWVSRGMLVSIVTWFRPWAQDWELANFKTNKVSQLKADPLCNLFPTLQQTLSNPTMVSMTHCPKQLIQRLWRLLKSPWVTWLTCESLFSHLND